MAVKIYESICLHAQGKLDPCNRTCLSTRGKAQNTMKHACSSPQRHARGLILLKEFVEGKGELL